MTATSTDIIYDVEGILETLADAQRNLKAWESIVKDYKERLTACVNSGALTLQDNKITAHDTQFIQASRQTWTYPPSVLELESALKQQQQLSQLNGTAKATTVTFWTLTPSQP